MNKWINEWMNKWINERMNKWMNEWKVDVKLWRLKSIPALKDWNIYIGRTPHTYIIHVGIQMKRKESTKTFLMNSNWQKSFCFWILMSPAKSQVSATEILECVSSWCTTPVNLECVSSWGTTLVNLECVSSWGTTLVNLECALSWGTTLMNLECQILIFLTFWSMLKQFGLGKWGPGSLWPPSGCATDCWFRRKANIKPVLVQRLTFAG